MSQVSLLNANGQPIQLDGDHVVERVNIADLDPDEQFALYFQLALSAKGQVAVPPRWLVAATAYLEERRGWSNSRVLGAYSAGLPGLNRRGIISNVRPLQNGQVSCMLHLERVYWEERKT